MILYASLEGKTADKSSRHKALLEKSNKIPENISSTIARTLVEEDQRLWFSRMFETTCKKQFILMTRKKYIGCPRDSHSSDNNRTDGRWPFSQLCKWQKHTGTFDGRESSEYVFVQYYNIPWAEYYLIYGNSERLEAPICAMVERSKECSLP